jgi:hypothetical protein
MSANKFKYFTVTTTSIVKAPNKTIAEQIAMSARPNKLTVPGELLYKDVEVERISAVQVHDQLS